MEKRIKKWLSIFFFHSFKKIVWAWYRSRPWRWRRRWRRKGDWHRFRNRLTVDGRKVFWRCRAPAESGFLRTQPQQQQQYKENLLLHTNQCCFIPKNDVYAIQAKVHSNFASLQLLRSGKPSRNTLLLTHATSVYTKPVLFFYPRTLGFPFISRWVWPRHWKWASPAWQTRRPISSITQQSLRSTTQSSSWNVPSRLRMCTRPPPLLPLQPLLAICRRTRTPSPPLGHSFRASISGRDGGRSRSSLTRTGEKDQNSCM